MGHFGAKGYLGEKGDKGNIGEQGGRGDVSTRVSYQKAYQEKI
jgi:hypothetical protein